MHIITANPNGGLEKDPPWDRRANVGDTSHGVHQHWPRRCAHAAGIARSDSSRTGDSNVTEDGAYDTRKGHDAIADRGDTAVIPSRKNAKPMEAVHPRSGRTKRSLAGITVPWSGSLWRNWGGYRRRSCVEI